MPTARCFFVTSALNDKIYVTGGLGLTDKSPNSWDIYDKSTNSWFPHKNPMLTPDIVKFIALDGELITIHKAAWNRMYFAGIYDPINQTWRGTENEIALCWSGPTVVLDGTLYMLDQSLGTKLMMWRKETKEWVMLGRLSDKLTRPPCELVAIGRKIYVIGRGLSTVTTRRLPASSTKNSSSLRRKPLIHSPTQFLPKPFSFHRPKTPGASHLRGSSLVCILVLAGFCWAGREWRFIHDPSIRPNLE